MATKDGPTGRTTARRRASKLAPPMKAGNAADAASFVNLENPEATIAAYCGFEDVGNFRRFYTSHMVLPFYLKSLEYRGYSRRNVLSLLADLPYGTYWASNEDVSQIYPLEDQDEHTRKKNVNYGLGLIAWQFLRHLRKGLSVQTLTVDEKKFTEMTACKLPKVSAPLTEPPIPSFGPFPGESEVEALNRVLCLFAHIRYTTSKSQWEKRFFGQSTWDAPMKISTEYVPEFMRPSSLTNTIEGPDEFTGPSPAEMPIFINVLWKHTSKNKKNQAFVAKMMEEDTLSEIPKKISIEVTPSMLAPEIRDRIREAFRLHEFEAQLEQLVLNDGGNEHPALVTDFREAFEILLRSPATNFHCLIRPCEDGEVLWEYGGPPAILRVFLEQKADDVSSKRRLTSDQVDNLQRTIYQLTVPRSETCFDPLGLFQNDRDRLKKAYNGFDVSKPEGRKGWQMEFLPRLVGSQPIRYMEDDKLKAFRKLSQQQQSALRTASFDGAMNAVDLEEAEEEEETESIQASSKRYYAYQSVIGGTSACVGPPIDLSARVLQMERVKDAKEEVYEYTNLSGNDVKRHPKPYQVNGAVWALSTLYGPETAFGVDDDDTKKHLPKLKVPGILILDQTGLGKTILALQIALGCIRPLGYRKSDRKPIYRPIFLAAPQNLIRQWAREILFHWPKFDLLISYDDGAMEPYLADHVVSSSAVRSWPDRRLWPSKYAYMFDKYDARNASLIFLTTPETNAERSLEKEYIHHPPIAFQPPKYKRDGSEIFRDKKWTEVRYRSRFKKMFSVVFVDEASKIKTPGSVRHLGIQELKARRWVFMTATAMLNQGTCILGPLAIIWESIKETIKLQDDSTQKWYDEHVGSLSVYTAADKLAHDDVRRLALINPASAKSLLQLKERPIIATCFPLIEDLIVLRRTTASSIPRDIHGNDFYRLRDLIKPHHMITLWTKRVPEEELEFQWMHRDASKRFLEAKASLGKTKIDANSPLTDDKLVFGTAEMRELIIITGSTRAALFNMICGELDGDTLVKSLDSHRLHGWTAFDVVRFMCKAQGRLPPKTTFDYAQYMVHGSPMLRGLIHEVLKHIKENKPGKILITEDIPLLAWWWDLTLNLLGIKTVTFHSALTPSERDKVIHRFNDPKDDMVAMVLPYDVGALGMNCQGDCSEVKVMSSAKNQGTETQAVFRPVRVNSPREVEIVKLYVENSICGYRESRKADKYIVELATRAQDPVIRSLAVDVLNEYQKEVQAAQDDPENAELMRAVREERASRQTKRRIMEEDIKAATKTVAEPSLSMVNQDNIINAKRTTKRPERFSDLKWTDEGIRLDEASDTDQSTRDESTSTDDDDGENEFSRTSFDPWINYKFSEDEDGERMSDSDSDFEDLSLDDSDPEEEARERPLTDRQKLKLEARTARESRPDLDESSRQLIMKLLDDYDRNYTEADLDYDTHLVRALRLIHAKKTGLAFDEVPGVHIKYDRFPGEMLNVIKESIQIPKNNQPLLQHLLGGGHEEGFMAKRPSKGDKGKKRASNGSDGKTTIKRKVRQAANSEK
ncbi:Helicase C-terminal [Pyrenophora teres f. maculata]|nr:Helicase C-terminal [Pyrenophora teres f. maculata]